MPLSTRELYLAIRVRDEGTRNLTRFGRELMRTGTAARIASLKAQADKFREQVALKKSEIALERVALARLRETGATRAQIQGKLRHIAALQSEAIALEKSAMALDRHATRIGRNAQRLGHWTSTLTQVGVGLETMGIALTFIGVGALAGFKRAIDVAIEYQRQVALTKTQVDGFVATQKDLSEMGLRVARAIAVPFAQIQPMLYDIFSTTNANLREAEMLMFAFAKTAVAGQVDIKDAARLTMGILNAFHIPISDVNRVLDIQFELVRKGAGTYGEFASTLGRAISASTRANQSFETLAAMVAYLTRTQAISTAMASTAAARALEAFTHPKAVEAITQLGVKVKDAKGNFRPLVDVLEQLRSKLQKLPEKGRLAQVAVLVDAFRGAGGTIQARRFIEQVLLQPGDLENFKSILESMETSSGEFQKAYQNMADQVASKSQLLSNRWMVIKERIGEALIPSFLALIDWVDKLLNKWEQLPASTKAVITRFAAIAAIVTTVVGVLATLVGITAVFVSALISVAATMGTTLLVAAAVGVALLAIGAAFIAAWKYSASFRDGMKRWGKAIRETWDLVWATTMNMVQAFNEHLRPSLLKLWDIIEKRVIPAFNEFMDTVWKEWYPKIKEAARIVEDVFSWAMKELGKIIDKVVIPAIEKLQGWWDRNKDSMMPIIKILGQLLKWFLIIAAVVIGVLVVVFIGPLAIAIAAIIAAFVLLVEIIQWVVARFIGGWNVLKGIGKWLADFFGQRLPTQVNASGAWLKNFFSVTLPHMLRSAGLWLVNAGRNLLLGLRNGISQKIGEIVGKFTEIKNRVLGFLTGIGGWLFSKGVGLVQGLINGIKSMFRPLENVGGTLARIAVGAVNRALEARSPSRVMMRVGENAVMGYIIGWKKAIDRMRQQGAGLFPVKNFVYEAPPSPGASKPLPGEPRGPQPPPQRNITNNITVNTHRFDPREQAALLGWELGARL